MGTNKQKHIADIIDQAEYDLTIIRNAILNIPDCAKENQDALVEVILVYIDKAILRLAPQT